jgi:hypothetical protein
VDRSRPITEFQAETSAILGRSRLFACLLPQAEFFIGHVVEQVEILKDTRVMLSILFQSREFASLPPMLEVYPDELAED